MISVSFTAIDSFLLTVSKFCHSALLGIASAYSPSALFVIALFVCWFRCVFLCFVFLSRIYHIVVLSVYCRLFCCWYHQEDDFSSLFGVRATCYYALESKRERIASIGDDEHHQHANQQTQSYTSCTLQNISSEEASILDSSVGTTNLVANTRF